jgi:hypothetical protein
MITPPPPPEPLPLPEPDPEPLPDPELPPEPDVEPPLEVELEPPLELDPPLELELLELVVGVGFGLAMVGRLLVEDGAVIDGAEPEDWFSWRGTGAPPALLALFEWLIANAAAKSAASSATRRPRRAGAGSASDMRSSAFWIRARCRRFACGSCP